MTTSGRLLLVDDEAPVLDMLADYFVERGYAVTAVASGQKALAAFTRERPDALLLDIRMSGIDGVAVLKRLHEADPDVPVIMVTANEDESLARDTLAIGAFDYVAKPFDFEHLDRTVAAALLYSARAPVRGMPDRPRLDDRWSLLVSDVFRVVRRMAPEGRASPGVRVEGTARIPPQYPNRGRPPLSAPRRLRPH